MWPRDAGIYLCRLSLTVSSQAQDEELYLAIAESFGWGPGSQRVEAMYLRLRRGQFLPPDVTERTNALAGWPDAAAKAKSVVRALGVNWAVHVHSIETVGGLGDEFYGEQWLNPVSRPKFVHATDAAQTRLPANQAPGGKLGLVLFPNPTGALIFNLYIPGLFKKPIFLAERPGGGRKHEQDPCHAVEFVPRVMLQQLAYVALDASEFGPHLLQRNYPGIAGQLYDYDTAFLKPFAKPLTKRLPGPSRTASRQASPPCGQRVASTEWAGAFAPIRSPSATPMPTLRRLG